MFLENAILEAEKTLGALPDDVLEIFQTAALKLAAQMRRGVGDLDDLPARRAHAAAGTVDGDVLPERF